MIQFWEPYFGGIFEYLICYRQYFNQMKFKFQQAKVSNKTYCRKLKEIVCEVLICNLPQYDSKT